MATNTGLSAGMIATALAYWASYPDDVDAVVADADRVEDAALESLRRSDELLAP